VSGLKNSLLAYQQMGLDPPPVRRESPAGYGPAEQPSGSPVAGDEPVSLEALREIIGDCHRCRLWKGRTHLVFGEGSPKARLMFVGEGPGREEDAVGKPFVGEAGRLLTRIIENGMGLSRRDVYICNVVKCRPPKNRDPEPDEMEMCIPFLKEQIRIIQPEVICTLGRVAGQALFGAPFRVTDERGQWRNYMGIPLMPTYHPAYLLRNPAAKRDVWEDVKQIMGLLGLEVKTNA
jgi:DNA polymerase